jgi:hypothetical protein
MPEFVSLGENCLPDDVLSFLGKKMESYPFGSGRFNIEYIIEVVRSDFRELLNPEHLEIGTTDKKSVVRNTKVMRSYDIYSDTVTKGFEFTHHFVLDEIPRKSFERKIKRFLKALTNKQDLIFIYHYRYNPKMQPHRIVELLVQFQNLLEQKFGKKFKCILWYQNLQSDKRQVLISKNSGILIGEFHTKDEWEGDDLWNGSADRDLFKAFFENVALKKLVYGNLYMIQPAKAFFLRIIRKMMRPFKSN